MISIILNGKKEEMEDGMNVAGLLAIKKIRPEVVTIELNDKIIEKSRYSETFLKESDRVEFVYYMGGGYAF